VGRDWRPRALRRIPTPLARPGDGTETQAEETEEPVKTEETATPAEEDEFDWAIRGRRLRRRVGLLASLTPRPSRILLIPTTRTMVPVRRWGWRWTVRWKEEEEEGEGNNLVLVGVSLVVLSVLYLHPFIVAVVVPCPRFLCRMCYALPHIPISAFFLYRV
jgi:hypothetical protein